MPLPASLLLRLERAVPAAELERALRAMATEASFQRIEGNLALDGSRTYAYFWAGEGAVPDQTARHSLMAAWRRLALGGEGVEVVRLEPVLDVPGASAEGVAAFHYVVETDVESNNADELADWYAQEHLPALAAVPGCIRARRLVNLDGTPRSFACYDLLAAEVLQTPAWLAVRETAWSSRVRPMFRNTRRTLFERVATLPA